MNSHTINFDDLALAREIIPFLRLRLRIIKRRFFGAETSEGTGILIVMPCILGDSLSCLPAIEAFADLHHTSFDIVVSPDFRSLAERLRGVRRIFVAGSSYNRATERSVSAQDVPSEYDLMIVLRLSRSGYELIKHVKCRNIIGSDGALFRYILQLVKNSLLHRPIRQSRDVMYDAFGLKPDSRACCPDYLFDLDSDKRDIALSFPQISCPERKVLVHLGSGWRVKLWSDDNWVGLFERIHSLGEYRFIFIGRSAEENVTFERIRKRLSFEVYSLIDSANLWEAFLIMKRCAYFIGIDSGPRNLAHYADLRSVTLLNPAAVKNFLPFDKRDVLVEKPNRFPINIINTKRGASLAMIGVDEVFEAFKRLVAQSQQPA